MQKVAVVTGASKGIGAAVAEGLARLGYLTFICYNTHREQAEALADMLRAEGLSAETRRCDVREEQDIVDLIADAETLGVLEVVVNNAGVEGNGMLQDITPALWHSVFSANARGAALVCREAAKGMIRRKHGRIVNISSIWGTKGASCESVYAASKAAVIGFTLSLAKELGPSGITVNCVAPGVIDTDMNAHYTTEEMASLAAETPLGRIGTPEDVAQAVCFLAQSSFITGQVLTVDGGFTL